MSIERIGAGDEQWGRVRCMDEQRGAVYVMSRTRGSSACDQQKVEWSSA